MESKQTKPLTLVSALKEKYSAENTMEYEFEHIQLYPKQKAALQASGGLFPDKDCEVIILDGCAITSAGKVGEIAQITPNIVELDITNNLITDWNEVFKIINQLKKLRFLNLCTNYLDNVTFSSALCSNKLENCVFDSLSKLVLNDTNVSLDVVQRLLKFLPSLEDLYLSMNGYTRVPKPEQSFDSVRRLYFSGNAIKDWQEVENLAKMFPNLISLIIMENPLENIHRENNSSLVFLEILSLTNTRLKSWADVDSLRNFKKLKDLKLFGIPVVGRLDERKAREILVARLPNIKCLNGTEITSLERDKAERAFIRHHQDNEADAPRRYFELVDVHGKLDKLAEVYFDADRSTQEADVLMHITGRVPFIQKIVLTQTLGAFKRFLSQMIGIPVKQFSVFWKDMGLEYGAEKMIYNKRELYRYGIKDGDNIYVDVK